MADYISFYAPEENPHRQHDPKKHIVSLLRQAKAILDKALDDAEAAEDIEAYCLPLLFEIVDIYFYLGLLISNLKLHRIANTLDKDKPSTKATEEDKSSTADVRTAPLADKEEEEPYRTCRRCKHSHPCISPFSGKAIAQCKIDLIGRFLGTPACDKFEME